MLVAQAPHASYACRAKISSNAEKMNEWLNSFDVAMKDHGRIKQLVSAFSLIVRGTEGFRERQAKLPSVAS